jgi:hypothetical protein
MPLLRRCHPLRVVFVFALLLAFSACAYDSNWGRLKAAQQRFAQQSTPEPIAASPRNNADANDAGFSVVRRAVHVRLRPNGHFLAQTVDAPRQLDRLIDDANRGPYRDRGGPPGGGCNSAMGLRCGRRSSSRPRCAA